MSYKEILFFEILSWSSSSSMLSLSLLLLWSTSFSVFLWNNYNLLFSFIWNLNMHFSLILNEILISYKRRFLWIRWECTDLYTSTLFWFSLVNKSSLWLVHNVHDQMIFNLSWSVTSFQSTLKKSTSIANDEIIWHDAIFLRLKMTKVRMNETKIVVLAHLKEKMIVRSEEDWENSSWESEDCWEREMSSISLCWINDMYKTRFFFCLWMFVFSAHLEAQLCILSQQSASLRDAQDQYFVRRKKLSWLLFSMRKAKTDSLIYTLYITLIWILLYKVELTDSTQSTLLVVTAHANWLLIFFVQRKWNQDNYSVSQKKRETAQDQYFVRRRKLSWLLVWEKRRQTVSYLHFVHNISLDLVVQSKVNRQHLINSSCWVSFVAHANWLSIFFIQASILSWQHQRINSIVFINVSRQWWLFFNRRRLFPVERIII